jgi:hypothetical protein
MFAKATLHSFAARHHRRSQPSEYKPAMWLMGGFKPDAAGLGIRRSARPALQCVKTHWLPADTLQQHALALQYRNSQSL